MKIGCCGFPVARARYFREFDVVEINDTFYRLPQPKTVERWRAEAPKDFEFTVKAWQLITHSPDSPTYRRLGRPIPEKKKGRYGWFRPTEEVREAWDATSRVAKTLRARAVLFQTPPAFYPHPNLLRGMYAFFRSIPRCGLTLFWEPRGKWEAGVLRRVSRDLSLRIVSDPLKERPDRSGRSQSSRHLARCAVHHFEARGLQSRCSGPGYFRLHGAYRGRRIDYGHAYTREELARTADLLRGRPAYVFFNNKSMWLDARSLKGILSRSAR